LDSTAFPTWKGNSVLTAHVYDATGDPGLFYNLSRLKWGDQVIVHLYGQVYRYEVREVLSVLPNSSAPLRHEEKPWLTLLTCQGYNPKDGNYALRLAVRAVLLSIDDTPVGGSGR
ncbi:MAG TPA: sortase, partial [Anaerolineaceae bacterium]|nr:sortase [Anaerolineaceae bacterium]